MSAPAGPPGRTQFPSPAALPPGCRAPRTSREQGSGQAAARKPSKQTLQFCYSWRAWHRSGRRSDLSFADQQRDKKQSRDAAKTLAPAQSVEVGVENFWNEENGMSKSPDQIYVDNLLAEANPPARKSIRMRPGGVATLPHPVTDVGEPPPGHRWETNAEFANRVRNERNEARVPT